MSKELIERLKWRFQIRNAMNADRTDPITKDMQESVTAIEALLAERDALAADLKALRDIGWGVVGSFGRARAKQVKRLDESLRAKTPLYAHPVPARKVTDAIQAIGRRSTPMRADEGRSPLEFDNGWNQCLDAIERHLKGEGE